MAEITCPKCGEIIKLDKNSYDTLVNEIAKEEIDKGVEAQRKLIEEKYKIQFEKEVSEAKNKKDAEAANLQKQIDILKEQLKSSNKDTELAVNEAVAKKEQEILKLRSEIANKDQERSLAVSEALSKEREVTSKKQEEIVRLEGELAKAEQSKKLAVEMAFKQEGAKISAKEQEIIKLQGEIKAAHQEKDLAEKAIKEKYENELKLKQEQVDYYKDLKTRMSTKLVGETLEQHCQIQFNQIRTAAYPNAYFEKDNKVSGESGSKGDFIFRDYDEEGNEIVSIMFEMKNENDTTATKHKNEDFFKELDKDRKEKGCEYAVLVSMLEADNEFYNAGIVDVSYRYPKMYVVRPQCFLSIISLIKNGALNAMEYKQQLTLIKSQSVDVTNFEEKLNDFQDKFGRNYRLANEKFTDAINEIDKTIDHLMKIKEGLVGADNNLRLANNKLQDLSVKKLTHNNPTMKEKFEQAKKNEE